MINFAVAIINSKYEEIVIEEMKNRGEEFFLVVNGKSASRRSLFNVFADEVNRTVLFHKYKENKNSFLEYIQEEMKYDESAIYFSVGGENMSKYELVVAIAPMGYLNTIMEASRAEGAQGGTSIPARGSGALFTSFMGMPIDNEKEIVLIVADKNISANVCEAIGKVLYKDKDRVGIVFSFALDTVVFPQTIKEE